MTKKGINRRTKFHKHVRQKAHQEGIMFRDILYETPGNELFYSRKSENRLRMRRESMQWNCKYFISGTEVDDGELFIREEDVYDFKTDFMDTSDSFHRTDMTVSLLDIAQPAKRKGVAKDFEVVKKVRNVIALEDNFEGLGYQWQDDEWEQIYDEQHVEEPRTYSSILRGNKT